MDRVHPEHSGLAVGQGVELAGQLVAGQDRQREVPHRRLAAGLYISSW